MLRRSVLNPVLSALLALGAFRAGLTRFPAKRRATPSPGIDSNAGPLLARGPYLVRSAERRGDSLWLRGDPWNMGQLINDVGPQRSFTLHGGILDHQGDNTLALAVWSADAESGGLGDVSLEVLGNYATAPP